MQICDWLNQRLGGLAALAILPALAGCAENWQPEKFESAFHATVDGAGLYGPITGFLQTPVGGNPGTTSHQRPTFSELNIKDLLSYRVVGVVQWHQMGLYGGANVVHLAEDSTLDKSLISHGTTFPDGTSVKADVQLDTYRFGYQHHFAWANQTGTILTLTPSFGAGLLDFDYRLKATSGLSADRSYLVASPQIGLDLEWLPLGRFSVVAGAASSIPEVGNLFLLTSEITGQYRLWGTARSGGSTFLGVGFEAIDYEDNQTVANHVKADIGPFVLFGLKVGF